MFCVQLWKQEDGAVLSAELVLVLSILVIGVIAGLKSLRDSVVTELADVAQAIANIDQSFSYSGVSGHHAATAGGLFHDRADFCDGADIDGREQRSKCVDICCSRLHPLCDGRADGAGGNTGGHY